MVISAVVELVDLPAIRALHSVWSSRLGQIYHRTARADFLAALGALVGVLVLDTLLGLLVGVVLSLLLLLQRQSGVTLHVARSLGQVRDVLRAAPRDGSRPDPLSHVHPSLDAAVTAGRGRAPG